MAGPDAGPDVGPADALRVAYRRAAAAPGRAGPDRRGLGRGRGRRAGRPGGRDAGGGARDRPVAAAGRGGAGPAGRDRDGQVRRPRAQLRQRRRRDLRGRAGRAAGRRERPRCRPPPGWPAGHDPGLLADHRRGHDLPGRRRTCAPRAATARWSARWPATVAYYERWAQTWEFQALLKARPVAGDLELGPPYVDALAPLVWQAAAAATNFVDGRAGDAPPGGRDIPARGPGRPRAQARPGRPARHRVRRPAAAARARPHRRHRCAARPRWTRWRALAAGGYVGRADAAELAAAYRFLRTVEHLLQLYQLRRTHLAARRPGRRCAGSAAARCGPPGRRTRGRPRPGRASTRRSGRRLATHARGPAAAREAVLPAAAGRGGPAARARRPADPGGGAGPAGGARATPTRPGRCATSRR